MRNKTIFVALLIASLAFAVPSFSITIDNSNVYLVIDESTGDVTHITWKGGSNQELVEHHQGWNNYYSTGPFRLTSCYGPCGDDEKGSILTDLHQGTNYYRATFENANYGSKTLDIRWSNDGLYILASFNLTRSDLLIGGLWEPAGSNSGVDTLKIYPASGTPYTIGVYYPGGYQTFFTGNPIAIGIADPSYNEMFGYRSNACFFQEIGAGASLDGPRVSLPSGSSVVEFAVTTTSNFDGFAEGTWSIPANEIPPGPESPGTVFFDDFESYSIGTFPSTGGWEIVWGGTGENYVTDAYSFSPTKSLQLWGRPNWSSVAQRKFSTDAHLIGYKFAIRIDAIGTGGPVRVEHPGFFNREAYIWGAYYAYVMFDHDDGKIKAEDGTILGDWAPGVWYQVKVVLDRSTNSYNVWINGQLRGEGLSTSRTDTDLIDALALSSGHPSVKVYYDDVSVFHGSEPPQTPNFLTLPFKDPEITVGYIFDDIEPNVHYGIDFIKGWQPFTVIASAEGDAMYKGYFPQKADGSPNYDYGHLVMMRHPYYDAAGNQLYTLYAHLNTVSEKLKKDVWIPVHRGENIGESGESGAEGTGIHLHFEVQAGESLQAGRQNRIDPYGLYQDRNSHYGEKAVSIKCGPNYLWTSSPPTSADKIIAKVHSPVELMVYDSQGRGTGLQSGQPKNEIPFSTYSEDTVTIFFPLDSYYYEVVGIGEGTYGLEINFVDEGNITTFEANDIPTLPSEVHDYVIDWDVLAQGGEGVTVAVDSDGDGDFEKTVTADSELTLEEFNIDPIADAGPDQTVFVGTDCLGQVSLNGSDSNDPDGDELSYKWSLGEQEIATGVEPTVELPLGVHTIELIVNDGIEDSQPDYVVLTVLDNTPPLISLNGPSAIVLECGLDTYTEQGATASDNCADDIPVVIGGDTVDTLSCGVYTITYTATDLSGNSSQITRTVTVQDTTPPQFSLSVTPVTLWPPNHKMVLITPSWTVSDNCDDSPTVTLISITMNEGEETNTFDPTFDYTLGDGHTIDDIQIIDGNILLRAERSGTGTGRVYTLTYQSVDDSENRTVQSATVTVPHNQP